MVWTGADTTERCTGFFATPMSSDFQVTHQWLRELRQWNGRLRMCAVVVKIPDAQVVWVGRYSKVKVKATAAEAVAVFAGDPWGNEVIIPGDIAPSAIQIRSVRQDVGWQDQPEGHLDCVCPACLARGNPKFMRKISAVYEAALRSNEFGRVEIALERARGRLSADRLLRHRTRRPADVARLLHWFKWPTVAEAASEFLGSDDVDVRVAATQSILRSLPVDVSFSILPKGDVAVMSEFCESAPWMPDPEAATPLLTELLESDDTTIATRAAESLASIAQDQDS